MVFFRAGLIDFVFCSMSLGRTIMSGSISPWPVVKDGANRHPMKTLQYLLRRAGIASLSMVCSVRRQRDAEKVPVGRPVEVGLDDANGIDSSGTICARIPHGVSSSQSAPKIFCRTSSAFSSDGNTTARILHTSLDHTREERLRKALAGEVDAATS